MCPILYRYCNKYHQYSLSSIRYILTANYKVIITQLYIRDKCITTGSDIFNLQVHVYTEYHNPIYTKKNQEEF